MKVWLIILLVNMREEQFFNLWVIVLLDITLNFQVSYFVMLLIYYIEGLISFLCIFTIFDHIFLYYFILISKKIEDNFFKKITWNMSKLRLVVNTLVYNWQLQRKPSDSPLLIQRIWRTKKQSLNKDLAHLKIRLGVRKHENA